MLTDPTKPWNAGIIGVSGLGAGAWGRSPGWAVVGAVVSVLLLAAPAMVDDFRVIVMRPAFQAGSVLVVGLIEMLTRKVLGSADVKPKKAGKDKPKKERRGKRA